MKQVHNEKKYAKTKQIFVIILSKVFTMEISNPFKNLLVLKLKILIAHFTKGRQNLLEINWRYINLYCL